jgi:hypothetical protein
MKNKTKILNSTLALLVGAGLSTTSNAAVMSTGATTLESWNFTGATDGQMLNHNDTKSSQNNLALGTSSPAVLVSSETAVITGTLTSDAAGVVGNPGSNVFKIVSGTGLDGLSTGKFEISYEVLGANFAATLAKSGSGDTIADGSSFFGGQAGFGITLQGNIHYTSLLRYQAATDRFRIAGVNGTTDILSGTAGVLGQTLSVTTLFDMDAGTAGSYYKLGAGAWTQVGSDATFDETLTITGLRNQMQGDNGGAAWYSGDTVTFDDVLISAVPEPSSAVLLGLGGLALVMRRRK